MLKVYKIDSTGKEKLIGEVENEYGMCKLVKDSCVDVIGCRCRGYVDGIYKCAIKCSDGELSHEEWFLAKDMDYKKEEKKVEVKRKKG